MPKIMLAPDLHCYYSNYGRVGSDGVHSRLAEWRACADALTEAAYRAAADVVAFPGDFFLNPRPSAAQVMEIARVFRALEAHGIQVIGCAGNHDIGAAGQLGPVDLVAAMGSALWGITKPQTVTVHGYKTADFIVLPFVRSAAVSASESTVEAAESMSHNLLAITRGLRAQSTADIRVFIGHWTLTGSISSSGQAMVGHGEPALPYAELAAMGFDAILMGHIHKPQVLSDKPFTAYAGALQRCDFGEERDPRGCWLWDSESGQHDWIDLPARRFYTIDLRGDEAVTRWMQAPELTAEESAGVDDAVVRLKYRCSLDAANEVNSRNVRQKLSAAEPHHIAGIHPDIIRTERARDAAVTEATQPMEALDRYLAQRGDMSPDRADEVKRVAAAMIDELGKVAS